MVGRILHFSQPYHLSLRLSQLVITNKDTGEIINRPIEDTAVLMLEHPRAAAIAAGMIDALGRGSPEHAAGVHERIAEVLADVLICLEYYLAALENAETPDQGMIALAQQSLAQLQAA